MSESLSVRFLYSTLVGRVLLKGLVNPFVSRLGGMVLSSGLSKLYIPYFIKKNNISLENVIVPDDGFLCFNDFFYRKRNVSIAPVEDSYLISPCDAYLECIKIQSDTIFDVKHTSFTVTEMLKDAELAKEFNGGYAMIFRLTPTHYHRYCYAANGMIIKKKRINGILHCVRPIVTRQIPVYVQNAREYQVIESKHFGKIVQMEVGALMVGKITNHDVKEGTKVLAGSEKGYFEFGGSTIIVLVKKDAMDGDMLSKYLNGYECDIKQGDIIGGR